MKMYKKISGMLAVLLAVGGFIPVNVEGKNVLPTAKFEAVKLDKVLEKSVVRYDTRLEIPEKIAKEFEKSKVVQIERIEKISEAEKVLLEAIGEEKVRSYIKDKDTLWIGTTRGLIRINMKEKDSRNYVQYFRGPRYFGPLTNSGLTDFYDEIIGIGSDGNNGVYVEAKVLGTDKVNITHIKMEYKTLEEKANKYEEIVNHVLDRRGMVSDGGFSYVNEKNSGIEEPEIIGRPGTNDNDGLWTAMYGMGEIFKYATLKEEKGTSHPDVQEARESAVRAVEAVLLLCHIAGRDNGFPARSYMVDLPNDDPRDEVKYQPIGAYDGINDGQQLVNGLWFKKVEKDEEGNPISVVQITKDSLSDEDKVVANKLNHEGFPTEDAVQAFPVSELTPEQLEALTNIDPDGTKVELNNVRWLQDLMIDNKETEALPYRVMADIETEIPERLRHLYEDTKEYWRQDVDGNLAIVKDNQIVYKADTSSDEMIGHMTLWYVADKYLIGENPDEDLLDLGNLVTQTAVSFMDHVLENNYRVMDATGKSTMWAKWWLEYFNGATEPQDPENDIWFCYGFEDISVNAMEMLGFLKTSIVLTEGNEAYARQNKAYKEAYELAYEPYDESNPNSGAGYADGTLEYINRRTDLLPAVGLDAETDNYTLTINYSDEELYAMAILPLIDSEFNETKRAVILASFDQWWENMQREDNALWIFLYQLAYPEKTDIDLESAVWFLERMPKYRIHYPVNNLDRDDVIRIADGDRGDTKNQVNRRLAPDEIRTHKDNNNPFKPDGGGNSLSMDCGTVYTFPYWMGRYYGMIIEK